LLALGLIFLVWRVPVMYLDPGGQDEDFYAVPGLTILQDGIPRLPHVPARNRESAFYRADEILYAEPPLYFYYQAAFYAVLPDLYGTGRLASGVAGLLLMVLMALLARRLGATVGATLWGVGLFSICRWFFFHAIAARPDLLCTAFGIAGLLATLSWQSTGQARWLLIAGTMIGLGGLTHPFAIVYAVQIAAWLCLMARGWRRVTVPVIVALTAIAVASLWGLLIVQHPDIFQIQFRNQFLQPGSEPLWLRLVWPWASLAYHAGKLWEQVGPWQCLLAIGGWAASGVLGWRNRNPDLIRLWWLTGTATWLIAALVGTHHPVYGYWSYPAALAFLGLGWGLDCRLGSLRLAGRPRQFAHVAIGLLLVATMIPGSGLRTLVAHLRHGNDINYHAPRFARALLDAIPADAVCVVDTEFALDFVAAGRKTLMAQTLPLYFRADQSRYDYLLVSRHGRDLDIAKALHGRLVETRGHRDDLFACYVEIYVPE